MNGGWKHLERDHLDAVERFIAVAGGFDSAKWMAAPTTGGWGPTQVAEHLVLTYATLQGELDGGTGMRMRRPAWMRLLLRNLLLPLLLWRGRLPAGVRAPRELRPGPSDLGQAELLEALRAGAARLNATLAQKGASLRLTHPDFGALRPPQVLRFCAIHARHHTRQLQPGN